MNTPLVTLIPTKNIGRLLKSTFLKRLNKPPVSHNKKRPTKIEKDTTSEFMITSRPDG